MNRDPWNELAKGRDLQRAILARGGPPPDRRDEFLAAVHSLDQAERALQQGGGALLTGDEGTLGLLPVLPILAWIGAGVTALSGIWLGYKLTTAASSAIDEAVPALLKTSGWILTAGLAWFLYNIGRTGRTWWSAGESSRSRGAARHGDFWDEGPPRRRGHHEYYDE